MPSMRAVASTRGRGSVCGSSTRSGKPMFPRVVMLGYRAKFWKTIAMRRSAGSRSLAYAPSSISSPSVISSSPAIMRSTVDLPQPEGPSRTRNSPGAMSSDSRSTTRTPRA